MSLSRLMHNINCSNALSPYRALGKRPAQERPHQVLRDSIIKDSVALKTHLICKFQSESLKRKYQLKKDADDRNSLKIYHKEVGYEDLDLIETEEFPLEGTSKMYELLSSINTGKFFAV